MGAVTLGDVGKERKDETKAKEVHENDSKDGKKFAAMLDGHGRDYTLIKLYYVV